MIDGHYINPSIDANLVGDGKAVNSYVIKGILIPITFSKL